MRRPLLLVTYGVPALCLLYGVAMFVIPWFVYKAKAHPYRYLAQVPGAVLLDDTGHPLRFMRKTDAEAYARDYLCSASGDKPCSGDGAGAVRR